MRKDPSRETPSVRWLYFSTILAVFVLFTLLFASRSCHSSELTTLTTLDLVPTGLAIGDVATTHLVLQGGGSEANPVANAVGIRGAMALRVAAQAGLSYGAFKLVHSGNPKLRKAGRVLRVVYTVAGAAAVAHNLRNLHNQSGKQSGKGGR